MTLQKKKANSENSWSIDATKIDPVTSDLSVKNPTKKSETELRDPKDILAEIAALDAQSAELLKSIRGML